MLKSIYFFIDRPVFIDRSSLWLLGFVYRFRKVSPMLRTIEILIYALLKIDLFLLF